MHPLYWQILYSDLVLIDLDPRGARILLSGPPETLAGLSSRLNACLPKVGVLNPSRE